MKKAKEEKNQSKIWEGECCRGGLYLQRPWLSGKRKQYDKEYLKDLKTLASMMERRQLLRVKKTIR